MNGESQRPGSVLADVTDALGQVIDPELGIDIVALGLVYHVDIRGDQVRVQMTMTTPACPLSEHIMRDAESRLHEVEGVNGVVVELVWDPPWTPERMSAHARDVLGWV